jgi:hypothetical protein
MVADRVVSVPTSYPPRLPESAKSVGTCVRTRWFLDSCRSASVSPAM